MTQLTLPSPSQYNHAVLKQAAILALTCALNSLQAADLFPAFNLLDINSASARSGQSISPSDYKLRVLGVYFAHTDCSGCKAQFAKLSEMQAELRQSPGNFGIEIIAVNEIGHEVGNPTVALSGSIPWVQDTATVTAWPRTAALVADDIFRDLFILNAKNEIVERFRILAFPVTSQNNYNSLKQKLITAAVAIDSDADTIPDAYETTFARNLIPNAASDLDLDSVSLFYEFAFGTSPGDANARPRFTLERDSLKRLRIRYRRWAGNLLDYTIQTSSDLTTWTRSPIQDTPFRENRVLLEPAGYLETTLLLPEYQQAAPFEYFRILPTVKP